MFKSIKFLLYLFTINLIVLVFIPSVRAVESVCPGGASPDSNVIWCDDFEDGTALDDGWSWSNCCDSNGDGTVSANEKNPVICGSKGYGDNCAAWNDLYPKNWTLC